MAIKVRQFINSVFSSNSYLVSDNGLAILIDVGDVGPLLEFIRQEKLNLQAVFLTHTHYDHIYGLPELMKVYPDVPVYTSAFGKDALNNPKWNFSRYHGDNIALESQSIAILEDNSYVQVLGRHNLHALATPGHDKSCLSYTLGNFLFSGDSYIPGIKVIATFPNSNREQAAHWYRKLMELSLSCIVYPGHVLKGLTNESNLY